MVLSGEETGGGMGRREGREMAAARQKNEGAEGWFLGGSPPLDPRALCARVCVTI